MFKYNYLNKISHKKTRYQGVTTIVFVAIRIRTWLIM